MDVYINGDMGMNIIINKGAAVFKIKYSDLHYGHLFKFNHEGSVMMRLEDHGYVRIQTGHTWPSESGHMMVQPLTGVLTTCEVSS